MIILVCILFGFLSGFSMPKFSYWILLAYTIAFPQNLFSEGSEWDISNVIKYVGYIALAMMVGLFVKNFKKQIRTIKLSQVVLLTLLLTLAVVGILNGYSTKNIVMEAFGPLFYLAFPAIIVLANKTNDIDVFHRLVNYSCIICCILTMVEFFTGAGVLSRSYERGGERFVQVVSGKGQIAAYLFIMRNAFHLLYDQSKKISSFWKKIASVIIGIVVVTTAVITLNRTMFLIYGLTMLFLLWSNTFMKKSNKFSAKTRSRLFVGGVFVVVAIWLVPYMLKIETNPMLSGKVTNSLAKEDKARMGEVYTALQVLKTDDWLSGHGFGSKTRISFKNNKTGTVEVLDTEVFGFHGILAHILMKGGVFGSLLALIFLCSYIIENRGYMNNIDKKYKIFLIESYTFLMAILLMSLTQNRFFSIKHTFLIGFYLGVPFVLMRIYKKDESRKIKMVTHP